MSIWLKLTIPILLGVGAAACNFYLMFMYTSPKKFVAVAEDINAGDLLASKLTVIEVTGHVQSMLKSAVSGDDFKNLVEGRRASRSLKRGDLLLWQDVIQPIELKPGPNEDALTLSLEGVAVIPQLLLVGQQITFVVKPGDDDSSDGPSAKGSEPELIGPFRLLSVGSRLIRVSESNDRGDASGKTITVAIPATSGSTTDANTRRLLKSIVGSGRDQSAIRAIILRRPEPDPAMDDKDAAH